MFEDATFAGRLKAAPFYADVAEGPEGGAAHWVTTDDGMRIRVGHWPAPAATARGTVLLFPGRTEYVEKYGRDARTLGDLGYATVAIDWRGQGVSARMQDDPAIGHVDDFRDYQRDVRAALAHVRALGLPEPLFLVAHSMGGCIGLRAVLDGLPVRAVCFSAPMWGIRMSAALRPVAWSLAALARPLRFSHVIAPGQKTDAYIMHAAFEANLLTGDEDMYLYMQKQLRAHPDLALGGPSLRWLHEALGEMRTLAGRPSPDLPCLTFLGTREEIVDPVRIRDRMARWEGGRLVTIEGGRHEVLMETPERRTRVFAELASHFDAAA